MSTIKDVAAEAGVSIATVSYVLNGTKKVSREVEERVLAAAQKLNYRANSTARNLRRNETRIIGYEIPYPNKGDDASLMQLFVYGISLEAANYGYHIITFTVPERRNPIEHYEYMIHSDRVDGFILTDTNWKDERIHFLLDHKIPFVSFGRTRTERDYHYVDVDGAYGIQQVVEYLIRKGHRQIAFIAWPENSLSGDGRLQGYIETLEKSGLDYDPKFIRRVHNTANAGYEAARELLTQEPLPTAIVCVSDIIAIGAIRYAQQHGLAVGKDIAISGFDDLALAQFVTPALTTISQPIEEIEREVVRLLIRQLNGNPDPNHQILIKPKLIIREST